MSVQLLDNIRIDSLSSAFSIPKTDLLLIAINRYGIKADVSDKRLRFKLSLFDSEEVFYLAVCINTFDSPFRLDEVNQLLLNDIKIGDVLDIEKDTCDTTYFRRNKTELTLNSNMRSQCHGCTFCGTYNLDPEDRVDMSDENKIVAYIDKFLKENKLENLSSLVRVTVCTGCFSDESRLVQHILTIHRVFKEFGFNKRIRYIGSQIRTKEAMDILQNKLPFFSLSLTVECFSHREQRMKKEKSSLDMEGIKKVLQNSKEHQFSTNYLYILGLDDLRVLEDGIQELSTYINRMPIFQIMQNYIIEHEVQRVSDAKDLEYYLKCRQIIESQFSGMRFKPRSWENYRGLFYTTYQNEPFKCIRR